MQARAAYGNAAGGLEGEFDGLLAAEEANAAEGVAIGFAQSYSETCQRIDAGGQDAFAAGFIDGRPRGVDHGHFETLQARCDGRGQTGRSAAYHEHIGDNRSLTVAARIGAARVSRR
jgi:hypothetical protein